MRNTFFRKPFYAVFAILVALGFSNCVVHHGHHPRPKVVKVKPLPPGQAKKISGEKSARRHAPGHNK